MKTGGKLIIFTAQILIENDSSNIYSKKFIKSFIVCHFYVKPRGILSTVRYSYTLVI